MELNEVGSGEGSAPIDALNTQLLSRIGNAAGSGTHEHWDEMKSIPDDTDYMMPSGDDENLLENEVNDSGEQNHEENKKGDETKPSLEAVDADTNMDDDTPPPTESEVKPGSSAPSHNKPNFEGDTFGHEKPEKEVDQVAKKPAKIVENGIHFGPSGNAPSAGAARFGSPKQRQQSHSKGDSDSDTTASIEPEPTLSLEAQLTNKVLSLLNTVDDTVKQLKNRMKDFDRIGDEVEKLRDEVRLVRKDMNEHFRECKALGQRIVAVDVPVHSPAATKPKASATEAKAPSRPSKPSPANAKRDARAASRKAITSSVSGERTPGSNEKKYGLRETPKRSAKLVFSSSSKSGKKKRRRLSLKSVNYSEAPEYDIEEEDADEVVIPQHNAIESLVDDEPEQAYSGPGDLRVDMMARKRNWIAKFNELKQRGVKVPHLVFAKMGSYAWWPATIELEYDMIADSVMDSHPVLKLVRQKKPIKAEMLDEFVLVRFFGHGTYGWVRYEDNIAMYEFGVPRTGKRTTSANFVKGCQQADVCYQQCTDRPSDKGV